MSQDPNFYTRYVIPMHAEQMTCHGTTDSGGHVQADVLFRHYQAVDAMQSIAWRIGKQATLEALAELLEITIPEEN